MFLRRKRLICSFDVSLRRRGCRWCRSQIRLGSRREPRTLRAMVSALRTAATTKSARAPLVVAGLCLIALLASCLPPKTPPAAAPGAPVTAAPAAAAPLPAFDPPPPELRLPRHFLPTSVEARLGIDPALETFSGAINITGTLTGRASRIWLHAHGLTIRSAVAVQGETRIPLAAAIVEGDLLSLVPSSPLSAGAWTLALQYEGRYEPIATIGAFKQTLEGRTYVSTQLAAIYARRVFPSFDEPDVKIPWQITLDVPVDLVAVSNTPVVSEEAIGPATKRVAFAVTRPLPSYLLAFGVGPYDVVPAGKTRRGVPVRIFASKGRGPEAAWAAATSAKIVDALEEWFGTPYPYEKLDMLGIPVTSGFGAMENAGLITCAQRFLLADPRTMTQAQRYTWLSIAGHEVAHQWFGDLVTPAWWDDVWLNEGFARWMEPKVLAALESKLGASFPGKLGSELEPADTRERALTADQLSSARRVRQPIADASDIFTAFDRITYDKGASVLTMFERHVGPDVFQRGVRDYLAAHRYGNATSADFLTTISATAGQDLTPAFVSFLEQPGAPLVTGEVRCPDSGVPQLHLTQQPYMMPGVSGARATPATPAASAPPPRWRIPVCAAYDRDGKRAVACATVVEATHVIPLPATACPRWVMLNASGLGYYRSGQPAAAVVALRELAWKQLTPIERSVVFSDVSALATSGDHEIGLAMSLVPKLVAEKNRFALTAAVERVRNTRELLPASDLPSYDAWVVDTFGPLARSLSWRPQKADRLDVEESRRQVLELVASAGEPTLRKAAVTEAAAWRALSPAMRAQVLAVAVDASPELFEQLLGAVVIEQSQAVRRDLLTALAAVGDEARLRSVLALLFEPRLDARETQQLLFEPRGALHRDVIAAYFREHHEPLMARLPGGGATANAARFAAIFTRVCDATRRDEIAAYVKRHFSAMPDGPRVVAQELERMDQCIAVKAAIGPSASAWLAGRKVRRGVASGTGLR